MILKNTLIPKSKDQSPKYYCLLQEKIKNTFPQFIKAFTIVHQLAITAGGIGAVCARVGEFFASPGNENTIYLSRYIF